MVLDAVEDAVDQVKDHAESFFLRMKKKAEKVRA